MPRLPTILVMGSQVISVSSGAASVVIASPRLLVAGAEFGALHAPLRLLVRRAGGEAAEAAYHRAVHAARGRRHGRARRLVHERHELVREAGHRAGDADAAHVGAAAHAVDPAALGHVALDHRAPAAELDQALGRTVLRGEVAFLVVAGPVAALVHGGLEQPLRPQRLVQRDHRRLPGHLVEQVQDGLGQVVRLNRAAGHADDRQPGLGLPVPAEVVGYAHGPGRVARHRVDAAVGGAGPDGEDGRSLGCQTVEPFVGRHRLTGRRVVAEAAPVALGLDRLVRDGALDHEHERLEFTAVGLMPPLDEGVGALLGAALEVDQRPVHRYLGQAGQGAEHDLLDAGLGGSGQRHRVPVAAEASVHPENMQDGILRGLGHSGHPFARPPVSAGASVKVMRGRGAGQAELAARPGRDRAGAWCTVSRWACGWPEPAVREHPRDRGIRWRWATRDRSRRASAGRWPEAPARSPLITCMLTLCRRMATGPSPVTTGYSCPDEISRQNRRVARHICLSVLARLRCPFTRTLMSYPVTARTGRFTVIRANRRAAMEQQADLISDNIEVVPVVVLSQTFPARPSSIPDVRDFVKRCLAQSPLTEQDNREVGETVAHALLEAAGPTGAINVSFRIFPDHVEVDVLRSGAQVSSPAGIDALASLLKNQASDMKAAAAGRDGAAASGEETAFADWMAGVL